jgi:hypothetical protein
MSDEQAARPMFGAAVAGMARITDGLAQSIRLLAEDAGTTATDYLGNQYVIKDRVVFLRVTRAALVLDELMALQAPTDVLDEDGDDDTPEAQARGVAQLRSFLRLVSRSGHDPKITDRVHRMVEVLNPLVVRRAQAAAFAAWTSTDPADQEQVEEWRADGHEAAPQNVLHLFEPGEVGTILAPFSARMAEQIAGLLRRLIRGSRPSSPPSPTPLSES